MDAINKQQAIRVSVGSMVVNIILSALKLLAGILGHSAAMVSDGVHTLSDVFSTVVVIIGIRSADKDSDRDHPYGHERFECVAAILLAVMLCATGLGIGLPALQTIVQGEYKDLAVPTMFPLVMALVSIVVKEGMYRVTRAIAAKTNSGALLADAWHHRSDALSSIGSFAAILGAQLGTPILDTLAGLVISGFIIKVSVDIFMDAIGKMTDKACSIEVHDEMRHIIMAQPGVLGIDLLHTRIFGDKIYVDLEINASFRLTLGEGHAVAEGVHAAMESHFPKVKHCMVHVNPSEEESSGNH